MGEMIRVRRPDGKTCPAYVAATKKASAPAVVCLQEYWGLQRANQEDGGPFCASGIPDDGPDLYRGKLATAADKAKHLMTNLNFPDAAEQDVRAMVLHLKRSSKKKVAVGGFCMGGALAFLAALGVAEMDAGAYFYGLPPVEPAEFKKLKIPLICHFANQDDWCTPRQSDGTREPAEALEIKIRDVSLRREACIYE
jgi:carboxymethylenebutenolidase